MLSIDQVFYESYYCAIYLSVDKEAVYSCHPAYYYKNPKYMLQVNWELHVWCNVHRSKYMGISYLQCGEGISSRAPAKAPEYIKTKNKHMKEMDINMVVTNTS